MLHWFGNDKKLCVQEIFHRFKNGIIAPPCSGIIFGHILFMLKQKLLQ